MRGVLKLMVVACLTLGLASSAQAQRQRPGGFGPGFLLLNESVQKELGLKDEQKTKLKDALAKVREDNKDIIAKGREMSPEDRQKLMKARNEAIGGILDEKQMKRLKQITLQRQGSRAFLNLEVQEKLKLTDEQKGKIKDINEEASKKMGELFQGGFNEETRKKLADLRKDSMEKAAGVLTADQKKSWQELIGKPFEIKFERPRRKDT